MILRLLVLRLRVGSAGTVVVHGAVLGRQPACSAVGGDTSLSAAAGGEAAEVVVVLVTSCIVDRLLSGGR